jgi:mono/diheme cytochrome c family protein
MKRGLVSPSYRLFQLAIAGSLVLAGCAVRSFGASDANLEQARSGASVGAGLYASQCAGCHGESGEGAGAVPAIMGAGALRRHPRADTLAQTSHEGSDGQRGALRPGAPEQGRPEFVSAESLHGYLVYHMPKIKRQPMTEEDYWAVVQFMLIAHGSDVPPEGVSEANGAQVAIRSAE